VIEVVLRQSFIFFSLLVFFLFSFVNPAFSEEKDLQKSKLEILEALETIQVGVFKTKECVIEAKTEEELQRCKEALKMRKFEELQEMLSEMGMTREERKMKISPRQY
jgi:hypothetical protein